ncbi:MAG: peptidylprolyl isomerase [candidate division WOR-3 bacterium]
MRIVVLTALLLVGFGLTQAPQSEPKFTSPVAVFQTTHGKIVIELFPKEAPLTVKNFIKQALAGAFDSTTFHRVVRGFVIQGGDPNSKDADPDNDGYGGGMIDVEPRKLSNKRGTISMASSSQTQPIDSQSDCQFFINLVDNLRLDDLGFIPFGKVIKGMNVVDKIAMVKVRPGNNRPLKNVTILKVTIIEKSRLTK